MVKKDFKCFIGYKDAKKIDLYAYSFHKWVHIKLKLKTKSFLLKDENLLEKYNEI